MIELSLASLLQVFFFSALVTAFICWTLTHDGDRIGVFMGGLGILNIGFGLARLAGA